MLERPVLEQEAARIRLTIARYTPARSTIFAFNLAGDDIVQLTHLERGDLWHTLSELVTSWKTMQPRIIPKEQERVVLSTDTLHLLGGELERDQPEGSGFIVIIGRGRGVSYLSSIRDRRAVIAILEDVLRGLRGGLH